VKEQGEDTPIESDSSEEEKEEEGEVTPPSQSLPFSDITSRQVGITIDQCRSKWIRTGTRSMID
jgi:hypothetical protein